MGQNIEQLKKYCQKMLEGARIKNIDANIHFATALMSLLSERELASSEDIPPLVGLAEHSEQSAKYQMNLSGLTLKNTETGKVEVLTEPQAQVIRLLLNSIGDIVPYREFLESDVGKANRWDKQRISVIINSNQYNGLKAKMRKLGLFIENSSGKGYLLRELKY